MSVVVMKRMKGGLLVVGMLAASTVGGLLAGLVSRSTAPTSSDKAAIEAGFFKAMNARAATAFGQEGFVMATGELDNGMEAVYVLDSVTGEIRGASLNSQTRKFSYAFGYSNLIKDLGIETVKNPKYVMITGVADLPVGARGSKLGRSVIYVGELNSGAVAAYGAPYDRSGKQGQYTLQPLDRFKFREQSLIRN